jgi:hypothetical protein
VAHPAWSIATEVVRYLKAASKHLTFGGWPGASINNPSGRQETFGSLMAHTKLRSLEDIDGELFAGWVQQARELTGYG